MIGKDKLEYEIISGNEKIVFIKVGAGGNVRGFENKYFRMAQRIHETLGATVICASNPDTPHEVNDEEEIRRVASKMGFASYELYFIGTSDGAYHNLLLAGRFTETVRFIGINTSYIDITDLEERLKALPDVSKTLIYGSEDDDFDEVVPALRKMECDKLEIKIVDGADHRFTGMTEKFIGLCVTLSHN